MTREMYMKKRTELLDEAEKLLGAGKLDEFEAKKKEIESLDDTYDREAKAEADLNAMRGNADYRITNMIPGSAVAAEGFRTFERIAAGDVGADLTNASPEYLEAWAKRMQNLKLTDTESETISMVNAAYTHTTESTGIVIPKTVVDGIFERAAELYPMFGEVYRTTIRGNVTLIVEDTSSDAAWYDEATETADGKETLKTIELTGCELARNVKISWKLRTMSTADFIPYITRKMAQKMGKALGYSVPHGKGKPGDSDSHKPEPLGIITKMEKEGGTPRVKTYTAGSLSYNDMTAARAKIKSAFAGGLVIYANSNTVWGEIANVLDQNGRPIFVNNATDGGVGRALGSVVKEDDSLLDGEILFANIAEGYDMNVNQDVTISAFEDPDNRLTKYVGYAIVDGAPVEMEAFSLLKKA